MKIIICFFVLLTFIGCRSKKSIRERRAIIHEIRFQDNKHLFGTEEIDSVIVLSCFVGSGCGPRASATNLKVVTSKKDTVRIFDLCGQTAYDLHTKYKFIPSKVKFSDSSNFGYVVASDEPAGSAKYKIYFGKLIR
jgi:hypothetical protein